MCVTGVPMGLFVRVSAMMLVRLVRLFVFRVRIRFRMFLVTA